MLRLAVSCSSWSPRRHATDSRSSGRRVSSSPRGLLAPGGEDGRRRGARACAGVDAGQELSELGGRDGRRSRRARAGRARPRSAGRGSRRSKPRGSVPAPTSRPPAVARRSRSSWGAPSPTSAAPIASPVPASATLPCQRQGARQRYGLDLAIRACDQPATHARLARDERRQQGAVRDHVDEARHSSRDAVQQAQRGPREEPRGAAAAGDREPVMDVRDRLPARERPEVPAQRDALVQLRELRVQEQLAELGLADEHDAQQLPGRRLEVQEQPDLLQQLDRERLRLVEHDDARPTRLALRDQVARAAPPPDRPGSRPASEARTRGMILAQQLARRERRVRRCRRRRRRDPARRGTYAAASSCRCRRRR